jgi:hypothetical protein
VFVALLPRRNNFTFRAPNVTALGVQSMGTFTMTDTERREKRKHQVERHRSLAQEITDPLAAFLRPNIISESEADPRERLAEGGKRRDQKTARIMPWSAKRRPA